MIQSPRSRVAYPTRRSNRPDPLVVDQDNEDLPSPAQSHKSNGHARREVQRHRSPTPDIGPNTIPDPDPIPSTTGRAKRGFTMPLASTVRMVTPGVAETDEYHRKAMIERLMGNVRERLGQPYVFPDGFKQSIKPDSQGEKKYSGTPKFKDLETWLVTVTNRFALSRLGGASSKIDRLRVDFLQSWLEGEALDWYNRHVVGSNQAITHWYFCNII